MVPSDLVRVFLSLVLLYGRGIGVGTGVLIIQNLQVGDLYEGVLVTEVEGLELDWY